MKDEIVNRVSQSKLTTFDLETYYPNGKRVRFDIKDWLYEGFILREKEFRDFAKNHSWEQYKDQHVALHCSTDAIIPAWAYMLLTTYLNPHVKTVVIGDLVQLETIIYQQIINDLDLSDLRDKPVIIKGCSDKPIPENAYIMLLKKIQPIAKSVMYGEACSSVPLFKSKK